MYIPECIAIIVLGWYTDCTKIANFNDIDSPSVITDHLKEILFL